MLALSCVIRSLHRFTSACSFFFFFNDTATTEIYTLSLHDALPICQPIGGEIDRVASPLVERDQVVGRFVRSEEHTSELQSQSNLVCRLLLEKKKIKYTCIQILYNVDIKIHEYVSHLRHTLQDCRLI